MSRYSLIQSTFSEYREAQYQYWIDLQKIVSLVSTGFAEYLGVDTASSGDGKYVDFGKKQGDKFEPCHTRDLDAWRLELEFALQVLIEESETKHPKDRLIISMSVKRSQGSYVFKIETPEGDDFVAVPVEFEQADQEPLYQALLSLTLQYYDPRIFE